MRVNTEQSIKLGERIYEEYGSWENARKAARLQNGVYVLPARPKDDQQDTLPVRSARRG
jgi:hypothetical protein